MSSWKNSCPHLHFTHPHSLCCGYAFAAECILLKSISPSSCFTVHFIGAIIYDDTGNALKNCYLMKMDKHKKVWVQGFTNETPMKLGNFSRASKMSPALTHVCSSPSYSFQLTNAPPTDAFAAITNYRMKRNITSGSPLAAIRSTIQETRAH